MNMNQGIVPGTYIMPTNRRNNMAYTPRNTGSSSTGSSFSKGASSSGTVSKSKIEALVNTGLFAPEEGSPSKAIASVKLKEEVTIPAGSYINLYENDRRKKDSDPVFKLQIREAKKKV